MDINVKITRYADRKYFVMYYDDPLSGRRITLSTKQTTEKEALKAAGEWQKALRDETYKPKSYVTWADFRQQFLDYLANAPEKTFASYLTAIKAVERHLKIDKLASLDAKRIAHLTQKLLAEKKRNGKKRSIETVRSYLVHLRAALRWAAEDAQDLLVKVPEIKLPQRDKGDKRSKGRAITLEEFERLLDKLEAGILKCGIGKPVQNGNRRFGAEAMKRRREAQAKRAKENAPAFKRLARGLWLSGLRLGEALNLSWTDEDKILVDLSDKWPILRIPPHQQKNGEDTLLPITPDFAKFLLETAPEHRVGPVFPIPGKRAGHLADTNYVGRIISAAGQLAGVVVDKDSGKFASAHDLRRAFGRRWAQKVTPATLMELMRHGDIDTTIKFYVGKNAQATAETLWAMEPAPAEVEV